MEFNNEIKEPVSENNPESSGIVKERLNVIAVCLKKGMASADIDKEYSVKWNLTPRTIGRYRKAIKEKLNGKNILYEILTDFQIEAKLSAIIDGKIRIEKNFLTKEGFVKIMCLPDFSDISDTALKLTRIRAINAKQQKNDKINGNK